MSQFIELLHIRNEDGYYYLQYNTFNTSYIVNVRKLHHGHCGKLYQAALSGRLPLDDLWHKAKPAIEAAEVTEVILKDGRKFWVCESYPTVMGMLMSDVQRQCALINELVEQRREQKELWDKSFGHIKVSDCDAKPKKVRTVLYINNEKYFVAETAIGGKWNIPNIKGGGKASIFPGDVVDIEIIIPQ